MDIYIYIWNSTGKFSGAENHQQVLHAEKGSIWTDDPKFRFLSMIFHDNCIKIIYSLR